MKILIFSDSHSALSFMRRCVAAVKPDQMIHLGDHYDDGSVLSEEFPHLPIHQVPGNCDRYRCPPGVLETICYDVGGVRLFMTHGHRQNVKYGIGRLVAEAHTLQAQAALYGHTHVAYCEKDETGMWVINPGSAGYGGGSAALLTTEKNTILSCRILRQEDLEEMTGV